MTGTVVGKSGVRRAELHRWWWRAALWLPGFGVLMAVGLILHDDPDPVVIALVVAVVVAAGSLVLDASRASTPSWRIAAPSVAGLGRTDPRTAAHLRLVESQLSAAQPDSALRDRLRVLADRVLRTRHELEVDDPRAEALLGPDLLGVLRGPPRRVSVAELARHVRRIEEL